MKLLVKCKACGGSGKTELSPEFVETLELFKGKSKLSASDVLDKLGAGAHVTPNAINGRLETLRKLGLLERERQGRRYLYSRTKVKPEASNG